jgi:hypothetical protein
MCETRSLEQGALSTKARHGGRPFDPSSRVASFHANPVLAGTLSGPRDSRPAHADTIGLDRE